MRRTCVCVHARAVNAPTCYITQFKEHRARPTQSHPEDPWFTKKGHCEFKTLGLPLMSIPASFPISDWEVQKGISLPSILLQSPTMSSVVQDYRCHVTPPLCCHTAGTARIGSLQLLVTHFLHGRHDCKDKSNICGPRFLRRTPCRDGGPCSSGSSYCPQLSVWARLTVCATANLKTRLPVRLFL